MGRLWEGMGMGGRGNDRWSRWQHSQPFTLNHYNHYYNYYFYYYQQSQAPSTQQQRIWAIYSCQGGGYDCVLLSLMIWIPIARVIYPMIYANHWSIKVCIVSYGSWLHVLHWYNAQIGSILPNTTRRHPLPFCSSIVNILWILFAWSCVPHLVLLNATILKGFYAA